MSDPSPWIRQDYLEYLRRYDAAKARDALPPWFDPLDFDSWLSRQTMRYLEGRGYPTHPV